MIDEKNKLILLESYLDEKEAYKSRVLLEENSIKHKYFCSRNNIEKAYLISNSNPTEIWVNKEDFNLAYEIIRTDTSSNENDNINIKDFSDDELIDILKNADEWHKSFVKEAKKNITERNIVIDNNEIDAHVKEKLLLLKNGKTAHPATIFIFWMLTFFSIFYILLGFIGFIFGFSGIIAGYLYWKTKITGFDNNKYYLFSKKTRIQGKYIFFVGLVLLLTLLIIVYYTNYYSF